jgi:hypothetical protein
MAKGKAAPRASGGSTKKARGGRAQRVKAERPARDRATRWAERGDALLALLAEHGAGDHEVRADLRDGRFVWLDRTGRVSAEARMRVLCRASKTTGALAMAWADPLVVSAGIARVDGMPDELDAADEGTAWATAMQAAEAAKADYIYRLETPSAWLFLALDELGFAPSDATFAPGSPVRALLHALATLRAAVEARHEPVDVVRNRLEALAAELRHQAAFTYRGTDWVARLEPTSARLGGLARRLPRPSFGCVAAGRSATEWLLADEAVELAKAVALLEDEWALLGGLG